MASLASRVVSGALLVLISIAAQAAPRTVTLGLSEGKIAGAAVREHAGLIRHLNSSSDFAVDVKVFASHDALYDAFKAKQIDFAALGPVKYVQARFETGAVPLAAEGTRAQSVIFVRADSPIKSVKELKGKKFAFGYEDSTSTYLMPLLVLSKSHIKEKDLARGLFIGSQQDKIIDAVLKGEADAGAVASQLFDQLATKGGVRALELSEPFPGPPVVAQKSLDPATAERFKQMLVAFKPAPAEASQRFGKGVHVVSDADYNKIRFLCKVILKKSYVK